MRKIIYIATTFVVCIFLKIQNVWIGFVPVFLLISRFEIDKDFLWEIPLSLLVCDVLLTTFSNDINVLVYTVSIATSVVISIVSPKKLPLAFPIIAFSVISKDLYTFSALWAITWFGIRTAFGYFTTKQMTLQEHKL